MSRLNPGDKHKEVSHLALLRDPPKLKRSSDREREAENAMQDTYSSAFRNKTAKALGRKEQVCATYSARKDMKSGEPVGWV